MWEAGPDAAARWAKRSNWHRWYAWYPVSLGSKWAWLEWVERRRTVQIDAYGNYYEWEYSCGRDRDAIR